MKKIISTLIGLLLILFYCTSCGPAWHLRQAIKKGAEVKYDTVFVEKTVIVPEVKTDTVFESQDGDTVVIEKDRLKIRYVNLPGDSVFIEGECKSDTVVVEVAVPGPVIKAPKGKIKWWHLVAAVLAGAGIVAIFKR